MRTREKKKKTNTRKYTEESLEQALNEIRKNAMPLREASRNFNIPRGTLQDRIHGRVREGPRKMGPNTILSTEEESKIVDWLIKLSKCGFPRNRDDLLSTVQKIVCEDGRKTPFKDGKPGKKWYESFFKRHSQLALRQPENLSKGRAIITENLIRKWFRDLKDYLISISSEDILADPTRILNGDETSFSMVPSSGTIIAPKGARNVYQVNHSKEKETLTVLLVFTACGQTLPPMVVFPYIRPPAAIAKSMPDDWILGRSESGWMKSDTFYEYVANGLHKWLNQKNIKRPVLFLVDGHKSHLSMPLSDFCSNNEIILYSLPPNTTHIMQPADVGAFTGLKSDFKKTVRSWQTNNIGKSVTKTNFCELLQIVLNDKDRKNIVKTSFRKCGLFPFNPDAIDYSKCVQDLLEKINEPSVATSNFSNADFETAKSIIYSLKRELFQNEINFQSVIDVLSNAQEIDTNSYTAVSATTSISSSIEGSYIIQVDTGELLKITQNSNQNSSGAICSDLYNNFDINSTNLEDCNDQSFNESLNKTITADTLKAGISPVRNGFI